MCSVHVHKIVPHFEPQTDDSILIVFWYFLLSHFILEKINEIELKFQFHKSNARDSGDSSNATFKLVIRSSSEREIERKRGKKIMAEWNLWQSIETALRLQRILCVSPFYLDRSTGKLKSCWKAKLYTSSIILSFLVIMYFAELYWNFFDTFFELAPSGMVWRILFYYSVGSTIVHFVFNMFIIAISLRKQMEFLERIHVIDKRFQVDFNATVNHKDYKRKLSYVIAILYIYYSVQVTAETRFIINTGRYVLIPPTIVYIAQLLILNSQVYTLSNYLFLLRRRYLLTFSVYQQIYHKYVHYLKSGIFNENMENIFLMKLLKIFELFREITRLTRLYDDTSGWIFAIQIIRTFMNILMQLYVFFLILGTRTIGNFMAFGIIYLFIGEVLKMIWITIAIHSVYAAVIFYCLYM